MAGRSLVEVGGEQATRGCAAVRMVIASMRTRMRIDTGRFPDILAQHFKGDGTFRGRHLTRDGTWQDGAPPTSKVSQIPDLEFCRAGSAYSERGEQVYRERFF